MESRIKQLREKRGLIQEILAVELGITQQMLSKYERDVTLIKVDILKKIAAYFNVTTDCNIQESSHSVGTFLFLWLFYTCLSQRESVKKKLGNA